jgi:hypothetical protein
MLRQSLVVLGVIFNVSVTAAALKTITVEPLGGRSNYSNPNLRCTPATWVDVITFYIANYIAHAATVITLPGEATSSAVWVAIASLLFPISGVIRGFQAILSFAIFGKTDLQRAARAGALCMVVRNGDWKPCAGDAISDVIHAPTAIASNKSASNEESKSCNRSYHSHY